MIQEVRPALRGRLHLLVALASPAALIGLILIADNPREYVSGAIFGAAMLLLFSASSAYHLARRGRAFLQKLDRSMIFVLIAGTYTPFCLVVLSNGWGIPILSLVWASVGLGIAMKALNPTPPRWLNLALYLAMGWLGVIAAAPLFSSAPAGVIPLLLLGGFFYSVGGIVHVVHRPDPFPTVFGYHEVFHLLTVAAGATFYSTVAYTFV